MTERTLSHVSRRWPRLPLELTRRSMLISMSGLAGLLLCQPNPGLADEEEVGPKIVSPEEGSTFEEGVDDIHIRIEHGTPSTAYTLKVSPIGSGSAYGYNVTTGSGGSYEMILVDTAGLTDGDWIVQLREGHNNTSGPSLDTVGFTITDDD